MKVHNDVKELLMKYINYIDERVYDNKVPALMDAHLEGFINSLALGKPEPLAKNKQFDNVCPKCNGSGKDGHDRCIPPSWYICDKCGGKGQI